MNTPLNENLKYISVRTQWGCQKLSNAVLAVEAKELLLVTGCRVIVFDEDEGISGERWMLASCSDVRSVVAISISPSKKHVAVCVKRSICPSKAVVLVYELDVCREHRDTLPHLISSEDTSVNSVADWAESFTFSGATFSNDSKLLACFSKERIHVGVLIFDWKIRRLIYTVKLKSSVHCVSFNPVNSSRICTGGNDGMLQFWHYTSKNSYNAPIEGILRDVTFTTHAWLSSDALVAGTSTGLLQLIVGCEVKATCCAFGEKNFVKSPVAGVLLKASDEHGTLLLAYSRDGFVSVSRVTRGHGRGSQGNAILLQYYCLLMESPSITGLVWQSTRSNCLVVTVASDDSLHVYDMALSKQHLLVSPNNDSSVQKTPNIPDTTSHDKLQRQEVQIGTLSNSLLTDTMQAQKTWPRMPSSRCIMSFHSGAVRHLFTSRRNSLLVTSSSTDKSVRLWDFNRVDGSERLIVNYSHNRTELPLALDIHPSGFFVATGTDDFATEHAVANNKLEPLRKIPMRMAMEKSTGEAVHNTAHVSLVRYSNGGHLLAVVTGKLAQVYRLNCLDYNFEKTGIPEVLMTMTDHHAIITDLVFNNDDSKIFTSSSDGQVFEWTVSSTTTRRDKDFMLKNASALQVAVSPSNSYIMATFRDTQGHRSLTKQASEISIETSQSRNLREHEEDCNSRHRLSKTFSHGGEEQVANGSNRSYLAIWKGCITSNGSEEIVLELEIPVTSLCLGRLDGRNSADMCILGLSNGSVLVSVLPLPLRVFVPKTNFPVRALSRDEGSMRDMSCRSTRIANLSGLRLQSSSMVDDVCDNDGVRENDNIDVPLSAAKKTQPDKSINCGIPGAPLVNKSITRRESFSGDDKQQYMTIDDTCCRVLQLHDGPVTNVVMAATGLWIFTAGLDGCIFMLNSSLRAREMVEVVESQSNENHIVLTDRLNLKNSLNSLEDKDAMIEEMTKDFQKSINELNLTKKNETDALHELMKREISLRDDIIRQGRNDLLQTKSNSSDQIDAVHKHYKEQLAELEVMYERKLAHESLYLQNMKQAYDEFVTHARMDLEDNGRKAQLREQSLHQQNEDIVNLTEKNKKILLQYCEYVGERHREVLASLTEQHDKDKEAMTLALRERQEEISNMKGDFRHEKVKVKREMQKLSAQMATKDMEVLNTAQELDRAQDRAARLEMALQTAMDDIGRKQEALTRWEFKCGEQQQKLSELERVRKALVSQLHALREEMGPKDVKIIKTVDKLGEVNKEYDKSIKAISDKEQRLAQNSNTLNLMNKQVRELRQSVSNKEKALKRAAQLLDEFNFSLQQARFSSRKTTVRTGPLECGEGEVEDNINVIQSSEGKHQDISQVNISGLVDGQVGFPRGNKKTGKLNFGMGGEIVELISSTPAMEMALQRLFDVLNPHNNVEDGGLGDEQKIICEKDRQITVLRNNIIGLKANIKLNDSVSNLKIHNYLTSNENLNEEMNLLRKTISKLSSENENLKVYIANEERARNARKPAEMLTVDGETANKRLPPFKQKVIPASMPEPEDNTPNSKALKRSSPAVSSGADVSERLIRPERSSVSMDTSRDSTTHNSVDSAKRAEILIDKLLLANSVAIADVKSKDCASITSGSGEGHGILHSRNTRSFLQSGQVPVVDLGLTDEFGSAKQPSCSSKYKTTVTNPLSATWRIGKDNHGTSSVPLFHQRGLGSKKSKSQMELPKLRNTNN